MRLGGGRVCRHYGTFWAFAEDVAFDSPSAAAAVVYGYNASGRQAWKLEQTQQSYGDWKAHQLVQAASAAPQDRDEDDGAGA